MGGIIKDKTGEQTSGRRRIEQAYCGMAMAHAHLRVIGAAPASRVLPCMRAAPRCTRCISRNHALLPQRTARHTRLSHASAASLHAVRGALPRLTAQEAYHCASNATAEIGARHLCTHRTRYWHKEQASGIRASGSKIGDAVIFALCGVTRACIRLARLVCARTWWRHHAYVLHTHSASGAKPRAGR